MLVRIESDPAEAIRSCQAAAAAAWPRSYAFWVLFAIYCVLGYLVGRLVPEGGVTALLLVVGGLAVAMFAVHAEGRWRMLRGLQADPHIAEPHHAEITPDGLHLWCAHVDSRFTWDGLTAVRETAEFYVFVRGTSGGPVVPKRVLTAADEAELRALVREWSPDRGAGLGADAPREPATAAT
jgi:hypothetical protein